jgi:hypothetical protein
MLKIELLNTDEYLRWVTMGPSAVSTKSEHIGSVASPASPS